MTWIKTLSYGEAEGRLRKLYDRVKGPGDNVDNIMMAHSLRPHSMEGHMALYKNVLHHSANSLPKSLLETLGVYVSLLNGCDYCVEHHFQGLQRLLGDEERGVAIREALEAGNPEAVLSGRELAAANYAKTLTLDPRSLGADDVQALRGTGLDDGEILEINQVVSYFAYANRTVLGLGINTEGDHLGLSPNDSDDPDNWSHR
ncbi:carboxymuconolactone decarboxylase family protein [Denitrobaculum tricleocarpae]|uniref:Peroxidase-related enzyme n=1 Tax=Denitrobaculum tricleocarpae TaxID=2591009 RepID=A0A545TXZ0_9PROT|nr:peroxidase-related enzyme [Denitrobaculum tricleocarpae]TQV82051.1 peroxidase-related enzyme [Denitrobaculum tricleocarpae]